MDIQLLPTLTEMKMLVKIKSRVSYFFNLSNASYLSGRQKQHEGNSFEALFSAASFFRSYCE